MNHKYKILALTGPGGTGKTTFINSIDYGPSITIPSPTRQIVSSQSEIKSFDDQYEFTLKWFDIFEKSLLSAIADADGIAWETTDDTLLIKCDRWFCDPVAYLKMWVRDTRDMDRMEHAWSKQRLLHRTYSERLCLMSVSNPPFTGTEDGFREDVTQNFRTLRTTYDSLLHDVCPYNLDLRFADPEKVMSFALDIK